MNRLVCSTMSLLLFGCHSEPPRPPPTAPLTVAHTSPPVVTHSPSKPTRRAGAGHSAFIDGVFLATDGTSAITTDQLGAVRFWPELDGSQEPLAISVRGASFASVARGSNGHVVTVVEPSGGARVFRASIGGALEELAVLDPFAPLFELHVLPRGEHLVALYRDHRIAILDVNGRERTRYEERRFRPSRLRISADGQRIVAIVIGEGRGSRAAGEAQPLQIELAGGVKLVAGGSPRPFEVGVSSSRRTVAVSTDGRKLATVRTEGGKVYARVVGLDDGATQDVELPFAFHQQDQIGLGFIDERRLAADANDGNVAWLIDPVAGTTVARTAPPQNFMVRERSVDHGGGIQAVGHGTWLFVSAMKDRRHRFLGYEDLQTQAVAISPSGKHVAWGFVNGALHVEPMPNQEGRSARLVGDPISRATHFVFVDDDHLVTIDMMGAVRLVSVPTGALIAESGVGSSIRTVDYDPARRLLLVDRHGSLRVFEIDPHGGLAGPYIVPWNLGRGGLLARSGPGLPENAVLWGSSGTQLVGYTLADLRGDTPREESSRRVEALDPLPLPPTALDRNGTLYALRWSSGQEVVVRDGDGERTTPLPSGDASDVIPAPDGSMFLVLHQRGQQQTIAAFRGRDHEPAWSFSAGAFHTQLVFSPDSKHVALATFGGGLVLDAAGGKVEIGRCGSSFEVRGSAPATAFGQSGTRTVCEAWTDG